jgi:dGTP triphosphohydrolase
MADDGNTELDELKGEIEALKAKNKELITELRKAKGSTNEEAVKLASELDDVKAEKAKLEVALKKATDGIAASQKDFTDKLSAKSLALQKLIRDEGLVKALTTEKVKPEFLPAVAALLRDRVEVDEEKLEAFVTQNGVRKNLSEFVKSWATSDEGKNFITAAPSLGGGAIGAGNAGGGGKAWKDMNLTEQSNLVRTNPELAQRLQTAG